MTPRLLTTHSEVLDWLAVCEATENTASTGYRAAVDLVTMMERLHIPDPDAERDAIRRAPGGRMKPGDTMTPNEIRHALAWAIVHAEARYVWQLDVYAKVGGLALSRDNDPELAAVYEDIAMTGPCNWSWHNGHGHPSTRLVLGRDAVRGERVVDTFNRWLATAPDQWPDVLPVPE